MVRKADILTAAEREAAEEANFSAGSQMVQLGDPDSELAWDDWISALKSSEATGTVRAHRLPVDADGNPMLGKGTRQIYLGSWPHQLYAFDDLLSKLTKEFLKPGETAHIKLTGTSAGVRGQMFARIVTLQKADAPTDQTAGGETVGQLFKVMQESQQAQMQVFRELMTPPPATPTNQRGGMEVVKDIASILTPILGPAIAAYIARPVSPRSELGDLIAAMSQMKEFITGDKDNGESSDSTTVSIVRAVAPALPQLLQFLNNQHSQAIPARPMRRIPQPTADLSRPSSSPAPVVETIASTPTPTPSQSDAEMFAQLKPQLDQLAQLAKTNADPVEVAKLTIQMLPEQFDDALAQLVSTPENFARLAVLSPGVKEHAEWFERLRVALHNELFEPDTGAAAT